MSAAAKMARPTRVLVLEDNRYDAELIQEHLDLLERELEIVGATNRAEYVAALDSNFFDVILSDYSLPDFDGMAALDTAREKAPGTPFIFVSGVLGEEIAIDSFKYGATDYILKQRLLRLPSAVERAIAEASERRERKHAEEQLELLVSELSHRVKNTLATVISIARQTARNSRDVDEYRDALLGRLQALSEAHALIFGTNWRESFLDQVLARTLAPYSDDGDGRVDAKGPRVRLDPKAALALSMIFHELGTNAAKYGALSNSGKLEISWKRVADDSAAGKIDLSWKESGGPPVQAPRRNGFGTTLLRRSIEYELDGEAEISYPETGLVCSMRFSPISEPREG